MTAQCAESRHVGIRSFVLEDTQEQHGPPSSPVLMVQLLPDRQVALSIEKYEETSDTQTYKRVGIVIVDLEPLSNALRAMVVSEGVKPS